MKHSTRSKSTRRAAAPAARSIHAGRGVPADLAATVARMKAAAANQNPDVEAEGRKAGDRWAREDATPRQLHRLARHADGFRSPSEWGYDCCTLVAVITNQDDNDVEDGDVREFFESRFGQYAEDDWREAEYLAGFVAAAVRVWKRVRSHI